MFIYLDPLLPAAWLPPPLPVLVAASVPGVQNGLRFLLACGLAEGGPQEDVCVMDWERQCCLPLQAWLLKSPAVFHLCLPFRLGHSEFSSVVPRLWRSLRPQGLVGSPGSRRRLLERKLQNGGDICSRLCVSTKTLLSGLLRFQLFVTAVCLC